MSGLILFLPYLSRTHTLPPVALGEAFLDLWSSSLVVNFWRKLVGKSTFRAGFQFDSVGFR
jgi:hypothetical protein